MAAVPTINRGRVSMPRDHFDRLSTDAGALESIVHVLRANHGSWTAGTIEDVAMIVERTGRKIGAPS